MVWVNTFSAEDLAAIVHKREIEHKKFEVIAAEIGRNVSSIHRRYQEILRARGEPVKAAPVEKQRRVMPHELLGIRTIEHLQATLDYRCGFDKERGEYFSPHCFRERVTLSGGLA